MDAGVCFLAQPLGGFTCASPEQKKTESPFGQHWTKLLTFNGFVHIHVSNEVCPGSAENPSRPTETGNIIAVGTQ